MLYADLCPEWRERVKKEQELRLIEHYVRDRVDRVCFICDFVSERPLMLPCSVSCLAPSCIGSTESAIRKIVSCEQLTSMSKFLWCKCC